MSFAPPTADFSARRVQPGDLRRAANRRNAQKSTGPKTAAGKRRVSLNRLKRGLIPREVATQIQARGEDRRQFYRLHAISSPFSGLPPWNTRR